MVRPTFGGFQTALTSLQSNSKKLDVTSQNLANMNVEGYTRQQLKTSSLNYNNPTSFYMNENDVNVGFGVSMDEVIQLRDQFLDIQYRDQNTKYSYNSTTEYSLNTLGSFMDESNMDGIRASLDEVQAALTTMQDTSKVQDPVYEGQLQSTLNATCVLLNSAADKIKTAEDNEFEKLYGEGTSEGGAVETVNNLLREIGELNKQIKHNQIMGNKALELQDERNLKIDELSSYIPITVESFSESYTVDGEERYKIYRYNEAGEIVGKSDWPSDLRISLDYTTTAEDGTVSKQSIILVNGTYDDAGGKNYGKVQLTGADNDPPTYTKWNSTNPATSGTGPLDVQLDFISTATDKKGSIYQKDSDGNFILDDDGNKIDYVATTITTANSESDPGEGYVTFSGGSVQASLDMLAKSDPSGTATSGLKQGTYYGYDYYMDQLDNLAQTLSDEMNTYNYMGNTWNYPTETAAEAKERAETALAGDDTTDPPVEPTKDYIMLVNRNTQTATPTEITAENISLSKKWVNGDTRIGLKGSDSNETVLNMLRSFTQPHSELGDKTYANYMNTLSTRLANDQANNKDALDTNKIVLDSITSSKDQLSGVSLDEEAANMMIYVSSYNAAAKIMSAFDETLQTLLGIV